MSPCVNRTTRAPLKALAVNGLTFPLSCSMLQHHSKAVHGDKDTKNTRGYSSVTWAKHQSPEIATQTHQVKRAHWRSCTSSGKDQVTQPHHPNQPHYCWRSRTCSAISPPAQLSSCGTRTSKRHPTADCPALCDTGLQLTSATKELPVPSAAHEKVSNLLQQEGATAEEDKAVLPTALLDGRLQTQPPPVQSPSCSQEKPSPFLLAAPGKQQ